MNNVSKYFDQIWRKRTMKKKTEINNELSKSTSSVENAEILNTTPKVKEHRKRLEFLNFKRSQIENCTMGLSSQASSISKQSDSTETHSAKEFDTAKQKEHSIETKVEDTNFENDIIMSKHKDLEFNDSTTVMDQAFHTMEVETLKSNCQNLHPGSERISVNLEEGLIHTENETFDIKKWIDKRIDYGSQKYSLDGQKKPIVADTLIDAYFSSKFNEKNSNFQDIVKGHLGNKIPYKKTTCMCMEKAPYVLDTGNGPKGSKQKESNETLDSKQDSLDEFNTNEFDSDSNMDEDDDNELYDYKGLSDEFSDDEDGLSLRELRSLKKSRELGQSHLQHLCNLQPSEEVNSFLKTNEKNSRKIGCSSELKNKLRFEKSLFYDTISSVQPYFQDNLDGPISHPDFKVQSARLSNFQDISPCSSPEPTILYRTLNHQDFKRLLQRSGSLKEIVVDNKDLTTYNGLKTLPQETQEFLEKMKKKSSLRLSKYQKVANEVTKLTSLKLKENLETMYKLDNDLQDVTKNNTTTLTQNFPQKHHIIKEALKSPRKKKRLSENNCDANDTLIKTKNRKKPNDKILRNIKLGPDARYYKLTEEEEELVEQILDRPDIIEDTTNDGCSNTSYASTGYDFDEEDAKRVAEINVQLNHLEFQLYESSSISSKCAKEEQNHCVSNGGINYSSRATLPQCGTSLKTPSISTKQGNSTTRTRKSLSHSCNKIQRDCMSTMTTHSSNFNANHYLEEQRMHRECQKRLEEIDKMLEELETMELPKLTEKEMQDLIMECKKEQGLLSNMPEESSAMQMPDSTSPSEDNCNFEKPRQHATTSLHTPQVVVTECGTVQRVNPFPSAFQNCDCSLQ